MRERAACRVQWVAPRHDLGDHIEAMVSDGGQLVARSAFEPETAELDELGDGELGDPALGLGIVEVSVDPASLARRMTAAVAAQAEAETVVVDFTGRRIRFQILPVGGDHAVIVRAPEGVERFRRRSASRAMGHIRRRLVDRLARPGGP